MYVSEFSPSPPPPSLSLSTVVRQTSAEFTRIGTRTDEIIHKAPHQLHLGKGRLLLFSGYHQKKAPAQLCPERSRPMPPDCNFHADILRRKMTLYLCRSCHWLITGADRVPSATTTGACTSGTRDTEKVFEFLFFSFFYVDQETVTIPSFNLKRQRLLSPVTKC